jgi:hypothetical protein
MAVETPPPEWGKVAPTYSNFFVVSAGPMLLRIAFGEGFGPGINPVYHTAIALNPQDAMTLAQTIVDTLQRQQQAQEHASQAGGSQDGSR